MRRKIEMFFSYVKMDFKRSLFSWRFLLAIMMVFLTLLGATFEGISLNSDVLYIFSIVMYGMPSMIILIGGALTYAECFCEDLENKYIIPEIVRGNLLTYVLSKTLCIFISAMLTIALGMVCYALVLHCFVPWVDINGSQYQFIIGAGGLRYFLEYEYYILYYFLFGLQYGAVAGILSLLASYISLFISNRMIVLAMPLLTYYFIDYFIAQYFPGVPELSTVFCASNNFFQDDIKSVLLVVVISIVSISVLTKLIYRRTWRWKISG